MSDAEETRILITPRLMMPVSDGTAPPLLLTITPDENDKRTIIK